jgi:hypothetical protein
MHRLDPAPTPIQLSNPFEIKNIKTRTVPSLLVPSLQIKVKNIKKIAINEI